MTIYNNHTSHLQYAAYATHCPMLAKCKDTTFFRFRKNFFSTNAKKITHPKQGLILIRLPSKYRPPRCYPEVKASNDLLADSEAEKHPLSVGAWCLHQMRRFECGAPKLSRGHPELIPRLSRDKAFYHKRPSEQAPDANFQEGT